MFSLIEHDGAVRCPVELAHGPVIGISFLETCLGTLDQVEE